MTAPVAAIPDSRGYAASRPAPPPRRRGVWPVLALVAAAVAVAVLPGCRREPAAGPLSTQPAEPLVIVQTTPQDATRSALACLKARKAARQRGDTAAGRQIQRQLRSLLAEDVVLRRFRDVTHQEPDKREAMLDEFVQGWGAIVGFYIDGLALDSISVAQAAPDSGEAYAYVPAHSRGSSVVIRLECHRGRDGRWRVARIDFTNAAPPRPATAPAEPPATMPATAPADLPATAPLSPDSPAP